MAFHFHQASNIRHRRRNRTPCCVDGLLQGKNIGLLCGVLRLKVVVLLLRDRSQLHQRGVAFCRGSGKLFIRAALFQAGIRLFLHSPCLFQCGAGLL